ncbi:MAG: PDDEXK nuclease domain-containing protein [Bacteroidales bacterium]|jgi:predicted nuclease of restriction endonuclease-like (RecB) superfamily|nr:PDDEXK nuclease domain-containing protein [Bacteroidales bacterium]
MKILQQNKNGLFDKVVNLLTEARKEVVRSVNRTMVYTYYEIGRIIVEDEQEGKERAEYGKRILIELSELLTKEFGKGYSVDNLQNMRNFYLVYSEQNSYKVLENENDKKYETGSSIFKIENYETVSSIFETPEFKLSWSHYLKLMRIINPQERKFYEIEAYQNNWSLRELQRQFDSALYERLVLSRDKNKVKELSEKGQVVESPQDTLKDPYILEFIGLPENTSYSETNLEQKLIDKLEHFLLELGKGFMFVGRQVRFTFDEKHFRVDLVFYNRILQCFVLIDLKIGELTHQDIGQMQMYVNYYDRRVKLDNENKTIGIILCKEKSDTLVKYTLPEDNKQIFASKYQTVLPSKDELKKIIENNL